MRVLFLDVDGVLNRVGFRPAESTGLRSWIEPELALRLCQIVRKTNAKIVLASDWRVNRDLLQLQHELRAAGIDGSLIGCTPVLPGAGRWREIEAWMNEHRVASNDVVIVDDGYEMGPLTPRFVRVSSLNGLDETAANAINALFEGSS